MITQLNWDALYPVEGHITRILEDIVVWVTNDLDITVARGAFGTKTTKGVFCMSRVASQCLVNLNFRQLHKSLTDCL